MYKIQILTNIDGNKWNDNLCKSDYSTFYQTFEYLNSNTNKESFPVFVNILDDEQNVVAQLGLLIIRTTVLYGSPLFCKILKIISSVSSRGVWLYGPIIHSKEKEKSFADTFQKTVPRLQRFYGGTAQSWLNLPNYIVDAYQNELPALAAEESIDRINCFAVGGGWMEEASAKKYMN